MNKSGPPMSRAELDGILSELNLSQSDAARMLRVSVRTVRRWARNPQAMYGPAKVALRSWVKCHRNGLDWGDVVGGRRLCESIGLTWVPPPPSETARHYQSNK